MDTTNNKGVTLNNIFYMLEDLDKDCWLRLLNGSLKRKDAFHTAGVATFQQGSISMRTMVLRKVLPAEKQLRFHTDIRSHKWHELQQSNIISLLFYDAAAQIQLRIKGLAMLHADDAIAEIAWQNTGLSSRRIYLTDAPPSSPSNFPSSGLGDIFAQRNPTKEESEAGKKHFGVISIQAQSMDWLWLNHQGHRRAFFNYQTGERSWLTA